MRLVRTAILRVLGLGLVLGAPATCRGAPSGEPLFSVPAGSEAQFEASDLVRRYRKNLLPFLRPELALPRTNLEMLDTHASTAPLDAISDSTAIRLYGVPHVEDLTDLTPQEKDDLVSPKPGVYAGIPSPVAATGALLGGIGLLVKLIADLSR